MIRVLEEQDGGHSARSTLHCKTQSRFVNNAFVMIRTETSLNAESKFEF